MATAVLPTSTSAPDTPPPDRRATRRIALASLAGTTIEFYDYFIYGTAAALVFNKVFFPDLSGTVGALAALATLAVVFVFRPVGSVVFGHVGDRLGRKRTLVITLSLMGLCTVGVGLMPGAATIGWLAPALLVVLRACQGLAVGGEWAGAALFATENAPDGHRGRFALFPQLGACIAFAFASLTFLVVDLSIGETSDAFVQWGWRVPFLLSAVLIAVGLYVRMHTTETPVFTAAAREGTSRAPFLEVWRRQPRTMLLAVGVTTGIFGAMTIGSVFLTSYATATLGLGQSTILLIDVVAATASGATAVLASVWSDRIGRRRLVVGGALGLAAWSVALFPLMDLGTPTAVGVAIVGLLALVGVAYGPLGAYLPELFATRHRYTGAGLSYNLGGVAGGAVILMLAAPLVASAWGPTALGIYMAAMLLVSVGCLAALPETRNRPLG
jgi:MFS family permease